MGTFSSVRLSTERPGVRFGFPLLGVSSTIDEPLEPRVIGSGTISPQRALTMIDSPIIVGEYRLNLSFTIDYFVALFNGYTIAYTVNGRTFSDGTGIFSIAGDRTEGGFGFGMNATFAFGLRIDRGRGATRVRGGGRTFTSWERTFNRSVRPNIDFVPLMLSLLNSLTGTLPIPPQLLEVFTTSSGGSGTVYGFLDRKTNQHLPRRQIRLNSGFTATGNILDLIPVLKSILKGLKFTGTSLIIGPSMTLRFPITIRIVRLRTPDGTYEVGPIRSNTPDGDLPLMDGPVGATTPTITELETVHSSSVRLQFTAGFRFYFAILKITVASVHQNFNFLSVNSNNVLENFIHLRSTDTVAQAPQSPDLPEVVWG